MMQPILQNSNLKCDGERMMVNRKWETKHQRQFSALNISRCTTKNIAVALHLNGKSAICIVAYNL